MLTKFSDRWVAVFRGPHALAEMRAEELRLAGVPTFVPETFGRGLDPAIAGGLIFEERVLVPRERVDEARRLLARDGADARDAGIASEPADALARMRNQLIACALLPLLAPIGLWLARRYFATARSTRTIDAHRRLAIAATTVCVAWTSAGAIALASSIYDTFARQR